MSFGAIGDLARYLITILYITVPLGIWKIVDILIWIYKNVSISIGE
jgi:uncharacterized membrane protein